MASSSAIDSNLILECREAHDLGRLVSELLDAELLAVAKNAKIYTFKHRFKSSTSILSKVIRKREEGAALREASVTLLASNDAELAEARSECEREIARLETYGPTSVTDVFGCRYVTLFPTQIPEILGLVLDRLHAFNLRSETSIQLRELVVYTSRRADDTLSIAAPVRKVYDGSPFATSPAADGAVIKDDESKRNAYTSVHLTFALPLIAEHVGRERQTQNGCLEIQIRDIFEEGWGEIDHHVRYSEKDKSGGDEPISELHRVLRETLASSLRNLKENIHSCGALAQSVHASFRQLGLPPAEALESKSATPREVDEAAIVNAVTGKAKPQTIKRIGKAYKALDLAQDAATKDEAIAHYRTAARLFRQALDELGDLANVSLAKRFNRPVSYFLRMEFANCILGGDLRADMAAALATFEDIARQFPSDPMPRIRMARCLTAVPSMESLRRAREVSKEAISLVGSDPLTESLSWIEIGAHMQQSFILWRLSVSVGSLEVKDESARSAARKERRELLLGAAQSALDGYNAYVKLSPKLRKDAEYGQYAQKVLSNLLYYTAELVLRQEATTKFGRRQLKRWLAEFEVIHAKMYREYFRTEDNLMHAHTALGQDEEARTLAFSIFEQLKRAAETRAGVDLSFERIGEHLHPDEKGPFRSAVSVMLGKP